MGLKDPRIFPVAPVVLREEDRDPSLCHDDERKISAKEEWL